MWDERYSAEKYAYGTTPNDFLLEKVNCIPRGKVLSLAEGEGRNAVFLAKQGYSVTAVEASLDLMMSKESLGLELAGLKFKHLIELERDVVEGLYHTGISAVVQAIATKEI